MYPSGNQSYTKYRAFAGIAVLVLAAAIYLFAKGGLSVGGIGAGGSLSDAGNLLSTDGYKKAFDAVSEKVGDKPQLLRLTLSKESASFDFRKESDDSAFGYTYFTEGSRLTPVDVEVQGTGSLKDDVIDFSIASELDPDEMIEKVKQKAGDGIDVQSIGLNRSFTDGTLSWTVSYEAKGRTSLSATIDLEGNVTDFDRV